MRFNDWGTAAELTAANPQVPFGEVYVERDTGKSKRGVDNVTRWGDLDYWDPEDNDGVSTAAAIAAAVAALQATVVSRVTSTTVALEAVANAINTTDKYAGKMVWNTTTGVLVVADGPLAADTWSTAAGAATHTPV
jgi:hypothetical protein